jgi:hypothetical protein
VHCSGAPGRGLWLQHWSSGLGVVRSATITPSDHLVFLLLFNVRNPGVPDISMFLRPQSQSLAPQGFGSGVDLTLLYVSLSGSLIALSWEPRT